MNQILTYLSANLLIIAVLGGAVAGVFWSWLRQVLRADDKANYGLQSHPDHCLGCHYQLAGLPEQGACPECGRPYDRGMAASEGGQRL
jgi:hypothetical protein